jgi:hypothetical protein
MIYGYNLGINYSNLLSKESLPNNAKIYNGLGFREGITGYYSIRKRIIFSPKMEASFNRSWVELFNADNSKSTYKVLKFSLDLMTHFIFKINHEKSSPYILLGPMYRQPISFRFKQSDSFKTKPDLAIDFGIGYEKINEYFVFAPELRYSYGLLNVNRNPMLQSLNFNTLTLVLNFK